MLTAMSFVVLLKTRYYAQVRLAFRTVVLGFTSQYTTVIVYSVPAVVAAQCRSWTYHWTVAGSHSNVLKYDFLNVIYAPKLNQYKALVSLINKPGEQCGTT